MPSSQPTEPGSRSGGRPAGGGGDLAEEAVGGPGGEVADGLHREGGRALAGYLAFPRPEAWAKALIAPACFVLAATSTGRLGDWKRFVVLWLVLEFLIYAARYQWNDIRGIDADLRHAERTARSRLPAGTTAAARRRSIRLSALTAAARVLAAPLIGALAGLTRQVLVLALAVFVVAAAVLLTGWRRSLGRWVITAACTAALAAAALLAGAVLPVLAAAPWLAVAGLYSAFRDQSYRDLVAAGPRLVAALRRARGAAPSG